jgi:hypothetical protein
MSTGRGFLVESNWKTWKNLENNWKTLEKSGKI